METKIIDVEIYRLKKEAEDYLGWMDIRTGKRKKVKTLRVELLIW